MAFILGKTFNNSNCVYLAGAISLCSKVFSFQDKEQVCSSQGAAGTGVFLVHLQHPPPPGLDLNPRMGPASQNLGLGTMTAAPAQSQQDLFSWIFHIIDSKIRSDCPCTLGGLPGAGWGLRVTLCLRCPEKGMPGADR